MAEAAPSEALDAMTATFSRTTGPAGISIVVTGQCPLTSAPAGRDSINTRAKIDDDYAIGLNQGVTDPSGAFSQVGVTLKDAGRLTTAGNHPYTVECQAHIPGPPGDAGTFVPFASASTMLTLTADEQPIQIQPTPSRSGVVTMAQFKCPAGPWDKYSAVLYTFAGATQATYVISEYGDLGAGRTFGPYSATVPSDAVDMTGWARCVNSSSYNEVHYPSDFFEFRSYFHPVAAGTQKTYVALGDSYSSGEGNPPWDKGTNNTKTGDTCHRSQFAWTHDLAAKLPGLEYVTSFACSGALIENVTNLGFKSEPPQLTSLAKLNQIPQIITVTMGGNDASFADVLANCAVTDCVSNHVLAESDGIIRNTLAGSVSEGLRKIRSAVGPSTKIYLVGYPNIINAKAANAHKHCPWLDARENAGLVAAAKDMDGTLANAASAAGVEYIPTLNALNGHELCTGDSWVRSLTVGGGSESWAPFDPRSAGDSRNGCRLPE